MRHVNFGLYWGTETNNVTETAQGDNATCPSGFSPVAVRLKVVFLFPTGHHDNPPAET